MKFKYQLDVTFEVNANKRYIRSRIKYLGGLVYLVPAIAEKTARRLSDVRGVKKVTVLSVCELPIGTWRKGRKR